MLACYSHLTVAGCDIEALKSRRTLRALAVARYGSKQPPALSLLTLNYKMTDKGQSGLRQRRIGKKVAEDAHFESYRATNIKKKMEVPTTFSVIAKSVKYIVGLGGDIIDGTVFMIHYRITVSALVVLAIYSNIKVLQGRDIICQPVR
jgi:hypothetical protein